MPTFWEQFKKPFQAVGSTIGKIFAKTEAPTPEGYKPYKSHTVETMAQLLGIGKRPSTIIETLEKPRKAFETTLGGYQQRRLEKKIAKGEAPPGMATYFPEELGKEIAVTTIEIAKNLARAPFKITKQFKYHPIFYKGKEPEWEIPILGEITTYGEDYLRREKEFRGMGLDDRTANIAALLNVGSEAILDVAILGSWLESGAKAIARKGTPELQEKIAAWKILGEPKNPTALKKSFDRLAHQLHPDKLGGSEAGFKILNNANQILSKGGIPTAKELLTAKAARVGQAAISPISKIMELPHPKVTLPLKMLPERAGYVPVEPYKPLREVKVGLQIKPTPMKPAAAKAEVEAVKTATKIVKYELPAQYVPKMGKATWKHGQMLWRTMRNSYGETNKFALDVTKNKGAATWVIDRLSGGTKKLAPLMERYEGQPMSYKQYKKLYAMFKGKDYDLDGYRHVMANLKGIEPVVTEMVAPTPAKTMAEVLKPEAEAVPKAPAIMEGVPGITPTKLKTADELLKADKIRPKETGIGKGRFWEYRDEKGTYTVAPSKEEAVKRANEALKMKPAEAPKTMEKILKPATETPQLRVSKAVAKEDWATAQKIIDTELTGMSKTIAQADLDSAKSIVEGKGFKVARIKPPEEEAPPMTSMKELLAERAAAPPAKPPEPPKPAVISPAPEEPKGLPKITQRRKEAIEKLEITSEEFAPALEAQKRGKIPFPEIIKKSESLKADIGKIANIKPGTIKNAEQVEAFRQRVNGFKKEVDKLKQNYIAKPTPISKQTFDEARAKLNKAIVNVEAIRSEMARGLSASRIDTELDRYSDIARAVNEVRAKLNPEKQLIFDKRLEHLDLEDASEVMKFLTQFSSATLTQKILEYYKASLLSAPITHIRNTAGNTIFLAFDVPVRALAGGLDAVKSIAGKPRTVYASEALRIIYSGTKAVPSAVTEAMKALRDEFYQYGTRRMTLEAGARLPAIKGLKGRIIRLPYRALSAMDLFSRTIKTAAETDALAYRLAKQEGKKGMELVERVAEIKLNPPADMVEMIGKRADRALFLEELNGVLKTLESAKNKHPIVQFITPFYRTPVNLVREAYRMTPARLATIKDDVWLKNPTTRMEEIARMILGSLIGSTIVWRMLDGSIDITGPAPTKSAERDLYYRQGNQPYSIRIGDKWYSYREVHPFSTIAFLAHQMGEGIKLYREKGDYNEKEIESQANRLITETSEYLQDLTFFQGISNFLEAISGGTYNQGMLSVGTNYVSQLMGGFIPNILYSYQRAADPTIYKTKGFVEQIQKRIPGMQESLLPKRSVFGIPSERTGGFLTQFLSPVKVSEVKRDLVDDELANLDVAIGYPQRSAYGEPLTDYEYDAYLQDSGARIYEQLWSLFQEPGYQASPNADKISSIEKISTDAREESRLSLFKDKEQLSYLKKKYEAEGMSEAEARKKAEDEVYQPTMGQIFTGETKTSPSESVMSLEDLRSLIAK